MKKTPPPPRFRVRTQDHALIRSALLRAIDWTQASVFAELGDYPEFASIAARRRALVDRQMVKRYKRLLASLTTSPQKGRR